MVQPRGGERFKGNPRTTEAKLKALSHRDSNRIRASEDLIGALAAEDHLHPRGPVPAALSQRVTDGPDMERRMAMGQNPNRLAPGEHQPIQPLK